MWRLGHTTDAALDGGPDFVFTTGTVVMGKLVRPSGADAAGAGIGSSPHSYA
jgi:hypothetical protein